MRGLLREAGVERAAIDRIERQINREVKRRDQAVLEPGLSTGQRYLDRPVYLLTSSETFSGGEDFCYTLQAQDCGADRRDDRRRRPPGQDDADLLDHGDLRAVRAVGQPGHRNEMGRHRRRAGHRRAGRRGLRRRVRQGTAARTDDRSAPPIADEARAALAGLPAAEDPGGR
jgi:hypothetical protein